MIEKKNPKSDSRFQQSGDSAAGIDVSGVYETCMVGVRQRGACATRKRPTEQTEGKRVRRFVFRREKLTREPFPRHAHTTACTPQGMWVGGRTRVYSEVDRNGREKNETTFFCVLLFRVVLHEKAQVSVPLVANDLSAREAPDRDDHFNKKKSVKE